MKKLFLPFLFLIFCNFLIAQPKNGGIEGNIFNDIKIPLANVPIILLDTNQFILAKTTTDINGYYGFNIPKKGIYNLEIIYSDSASQILKDVAIDTETLNYQFVFSRKTYQHDKNINVISASELEKMPATNYQNLLSTKGNFDKDANGNMRSRTFGNGVKIIVDGQIMSENSKVQFVPGSIGSMQVIEK